MVRKQSFINSKLGKSIKWYCDANNYKLELSTCGLLFFTDKNTNKKVTIAPTNLMKLYEARDSK